MGAFRIGGFCGCCNQTECLTCLPCCIPKATLTLSWSGGRIGTGSTTLTFDGVNAWLGSLTINYTDGRQNGTHTINVKLWCNETGDMTFEWSDATSGWFCSTSCAFAACFQGIDYTCSPFHWQLDTCYTGTAYCYATLYDLNPSLHDTYIRYLFIDE